MQKITPFLWFDGKADESSHAMETLGRARSGQS